MNDRRERLQALIAPGSVAIIGASDDPARIGGRPLRYLLKWGYGGEIFPINPNRPTVQGVAALASIKDVGKPVDCALVAVPASLVIQTLEDCVACGVRSAIVFSSGFAETGANGNDAQQRITEISAQSGLRILGPNCLGVLNFETRFFATFSSTGDNGYPAPGGLAIISQSGAYGTHLYSVAESWGLGVSHVITTGNECDVQVSECIDWAVDQDQINVICAYAEGVKDGPTLIRSLEKARARGKPVIFMKVGQSEIGAAAAQSHTASLAGADEIYTAMFKQCGAYRADTTEEMLDIAYACTAGIFPASKRIGLVTISGGVGVQMADYAIKHGMDVAPMPAAAQAKLKKNLPFASALNPVDTTAQFFNDMSLVGVNFSIMLDEGKYDTAIAFFTIAAASPYVVEPLLRELDIIRRRFPDRLLILSLMGPPEIVQRYRDAGFLTFVDPCRAIKAAAALASLGAWFRQPAKAPAATRAIAASSIPRRNLSEFESRALLSAAGIPVVDAVLARSADEARAAAQKFAGAVAMKVNGSDIAHKTELGGVELDVKTPDDAHRTYGELLER
ncbi:MAG: acetate--CoA ligase family protein, partial [Proteobacteria bacterium]|nr:acetate--CoA ligase family protein [Pseudomonadota bacterium]